MALQILTWWLASALFGLAGLPLTTYLFRALPDRGYAFSRALGLLLTGYAAWLLAMIGLAPFNAGMLLLCAAVVFGVGLLALKTKHREPRADEVPSNSWFLALGSRLFPGWKLTLGYEALFLLALVFLTLIRARMPDPWGTERPMDFALFNAIQRSPNFPPHDPWLAGYSINYYYLGYLLMASMALISGLAPAVAFNLSLALVFALTALGVAGIVANLIALTVGDRRPARHFSMIAIRSGFVVLSVVFVLLAGNQGGALQVITGYPLVVSLSGRDMIAAVQNGLGARAPLTLRDPFIEWGAPVDKLNNPIPTTQITPTDRLANFDWWWPSRALWDGRNGAGYSTKYYAITEFPMFSFWLGDMHPHVMALPFGLLALALALATLARPAAPVFTLTWRGWLELILSGIVLGSLYAINSWDFPTYMLMYLAALLVLYVRLGTTMLVGTKNVGIAPDDQAHASEANDTRFTPELSRSTPRSSSLTAILWPQFVQHALLVVVASFALFAPFYLTFKSLVGAKDPLVDLPLLGTLTRTVGVVTWSHTPLHTFVIIFGLFLLPLATFVFAHGQRVRQAAHIDETEPAALPARAPREVLSFAALPVAPSLLAALPWIVLGALALGPLVGFPLLFLLPLAVYAVALALRKAEHPAAAFALLGVGLGALVCFGTELVYIRDAFEGAAARMNTIFKFYYQVWLIWGTLAGYALWWLVSRRWTADGGRWTVVSRLWSVVCVTLTTALFVGALVYPWLTVVKALREQPAIGLDGKTPRQQSAAGAAGIAWLRANTNGSEVVLESVGGDYDGEGGPGAAGVSASTGLATVLGWPGHEDQWRGGDPKAQAQIAPRKADVETIYSTTDVTQARGLLDKYNVAFVYIGETERRRYGQASLDKFAQLGEKLFEQGEVAIYKIKQP